MIIMLKINAAKIKPFFEKTKNVKNHKIFSYSVPNGSGIANATQPGTINPSFAFIIVCQN